MLALGFVGGRVMLVDDTTGAVRWAVEAHRGEHSAAWAVLSPDNGRFVASVGRGDARWKLWDASSGGLHMVGAGHDGTGACTCEELDLAHPAFQEGWEECPVVAHTGGATALAFSPCGRRFATGSCPQTPIGMWSCWSCNQ